MYHIIVGEAGCTIVNHEATIVDCFPTIEEALEYVGNDPVEIKSVC